MKGTALILVLLTACRYAPTESRTSEEIASSIRGRVMLEDGEDSIHMNHEGIRVTLLGTPYFALTDYRGEYVFVNVLRGGYTALYGMEGYDTIATRVDVLPPEGARLNTYLLSRSHPALVLDTVQRFGDYMIISGPAPEVRGSWQLALLAGDKSDVSAASWKVSQHASFNLVNTRFEVGFDVGPLRNPRPEEGAIGFKSGDTVFLRVYSGGWRIFDYSVNATRWLNMNRPSNTVSFVMP